MPADLASLQRLLARTTLRVRVQRGLEAACWVCAASTTTAALWLLCAPSARWTLVASTFSTVLSFVVSASRRVSRHRVSAAIDRVGRLEGRVQAADEFMRVGDTERSAFVEAALRDACESSSRVLPAQAAPLRRPRGTWLALAALVACVGISTRSAARGPQPVQQPALASTEPERFFSPDELAVRTENARALSSRAANGADLRSQLADYLSLLARLTAGTLNQESALRQALALEAKLAALARADDPAGAALLSRLTGEVASAAPELADALARGALREAATALRALAKQLAEGKLDAQQRARLSAALEQARERERERIADEERARVLESLLAKQSESGEPSLLKRRNEQQRELEKLRRKQAARPRRQLEKLTRELARASSALSGRADEQAQDALDEAADALEHYEGEQHDEEARRELARELAQLREQLQQEALSEDSEQRAPHERGQSRAGSRADEPSEHTESARERQQQHAQHEQSGQDAKARRERQLRFDLSARGGRAEPADGGTELQLTPGGSAGAQQQTLLVERQQSRLVSVDVPSESAGSEHDARQLDAPTRSTGRYEDRALQGVSGVGPSRSQVIRSAAQSGFGTAPYRKVYADYRAHEEAWLEQDDVPAGYRFHVRRYFELVRPREEQGERR